MRRNLVLLILGVIVIVAGAAAYFLIVQDESTSLGTTAGAAPTGEVVAARDALLSSPQEITLNLAIDIPKGSESDNPDHQEIDAEGVVDLSSGTGELSYDFNDLNNSAGFLGHFDTMDVLMADDALYIDVFVDGPPWLRIVPDDIGTGDVARLHEILVTIPRVLPALLEVDGETEDTGTGFRRMIAPAALAASEDPFAAAIGETLQGWETEEVVVQATAGDAGVEEALVAFGHRPSGGMIDVSATYAFSAADSPADVALPSEDDVRDYAEIFGGT